MPVTSAVKDFLQESQNRGDTNEKEENVEKEKSRPHCPGCCSGGDPGAAAAVYAVTHGLYKASNYTADSDAMKGYTRMEEEIDEISLKRLRERC